jgi:hypothetical protein
MQDTTFELHIKLPRGIQYSCDSIIARSRYDYCKSHYFLIYRSPQHVFHVGMTIASEGPTPEFHWFRDNHLTILHVLLHYAWSPLHGHQGPNQQDWARTAPGAKASLIEFWCHNFQNKATPMFTYSSIQPQQTASMFEFVWEHYWSPRWNSCNDVHHHDLQ